MQWMRAMSVRPSIAVILNSHAGTAKACPQVADELSQLFRAAGCEVEMIASDAGRSPMEVARDASRRAGIVVAAGGVCEFTLAFDWGGWDLQEAIATELDVPSAEAATILWPVSVDPVNATRSTPG